MLRVNLQPKVSLEVREGIKLSYWWAAIVWILAIGLVVGSWLSVNADLETYEVEIKNLDFKLKDFKKVISDKEQALAEKDYLQGKRDFVQGISENQRQWTDFFDQMRDRVPKDVWFSKFSGSRNGEYKVEGSTFTYSSVGFTMLQMKSISHVSSVILNQTASEGRGGDNPITSITKKFSLSGAMELMSDEERKKKKTSTMPIAPGAPGARPTPGAPASGPGKPAAPAVPGE